MSVASRAKRNNNYTIKTVLRNARKAVSDSFMTKTIFITGGSRGIGEALVRKCAGKYNVAFTYNHSKDRAIALEKALSEQYGGVLAVHCDVANENDVLIAVESVKKRFGKIDVLVNNAGISKSGLLIDCALDDWKNIFDVNVNGVFNVTKAVVKDMMTRGGGSIVNVSSIWGVEGASMEVAYSATKSALIGFTKALAKEVARMGVRVNAVAPGAIDTDMMKVYSAEEINALCEDSIPLGRLGSPDEVADAILFLAENEYVSGEVLKVTGLMS